MKTLIVNNSGRQLLLNIHDTGKYNTPEDVVYDSSVHGAPSGFTFNDLGGVVRTDGPNGSFSFSVDATMKQAYLDALAAEAAAQQADIDEAQQLKTFFNTIDAQIVAAANLADVKAIMRKLARAIVRVGLR